MIRALVLTGIAMACSLSLAQEMPNINDVYSPRPAYTNSTWGPTTDAGEVLDRCAQRLGDALSLSYDVRVESPGGTASHIVEAWGTVVLARGEGGGFDRSRITLQGRTGDEGTFLLTIVSADGRTLIIDRADARFVELRQLGETTALGRLLRHLWLPGIAVSSSPLENPRFLRKSIEDGEPLYSIHFMDSVRHEHIYGLFSQIDALPRTIERVVPDAAGIPGIVSIRLSQVEIDPPTSSGLFDTIAPEGFSRVEKFPGLSH